MASRKVDTIYIVGPTASGKTGLSLELAMALNAEIVCADSQTIRKGLDIGTAKPDSDERLAIRHHMLDVVDPYEEYSLYVFQKSAKDIINDIHKRNKNVIIVGGTGLYVDSLYFDYELPELVDDSDYRVGLSTMSVESLQIKIKDLGLELPANSLNRRHLINTLLRYGAAGKKRGPSKRSIIVGINPSRDTVINRINARVDSMFENGFLDEVRSLLSKYGRPPKGFDAIGYRIALRHLDGEITLEETKELFKIADRQYAKRQMSWFKRNEHIRWFPSPEEAKAYILEVV